jgi:signal transducer and activator of transcription 5B
VTGLVGSLIQELETKANAMTTEDLFLTKLKLIEAASMFRVSNRKYSILF